MRGLKRLVSLIVCMLLCIQFMDKALIFIEAEESAISGTVSVQTITESLDFVTDSSNRGNLDADGYQWRNNRLTIDGLVMNVGTGADFAIRVPHEAYIFFQGNNSITYNGEGNAIVCDGYLYLSGREDAVLNIDASAGSGIYTGGLYYDTLQDFNTTIREGHYPLLSVTAENTGIKGVTESGTPYNKIFNFKTSTRTIITADIGMDIPASSSSEIYGTGSVDITASNYGVITKTWDLGGGTLTVNTNAVDPDDAGIGMYCYHIVEQANQGGQVDINGSNTAFQSTDTDELNANSIISLSTVSIQEPFRYKVSEYVIDHSTGAKAKHLVIGAPRRTVRSMTMSPENTLMNPGDTAQLSIMIDPEIEAYYWTSDNENVAVVDADGMVTAIGTGTAVITAKNYINNLSAACTVTVKNKPSGMSFSPSARTMIEGDTLQLTPSYTPDGTEFSHLIWSSSDDSTASVDQNGLVTANTYGDVTITAATEDGRYSASCRLTILKAVSSIMLNYSALTLDKGQTYVIEPYIDPVDAGNKTVLWSSSDPSIVSVDTNGKVTGKNYGTATITATTQDKGKTVTCEVTVMLNGGFEYIDNGETVAVSGYNGVNSDLVIPDVIDGKQVTEIWDNAFSGNHTIESVVIPAGVTIIWDRAFNECDNLKEVLILGEVTLLGDYVFNGCHSLTSIDLPDVLRVIGQATFYGCSRIEEFVLPESITNIGNEAFFGCSNLKAINIPSGIKELSSNMFSYCTSLETITIPDNIRRFGDSVFHHCSSLTKVVLPSGLKEFGTYVFNNCSKLKTAGPVGSGSNIEFDWSDKIPAHVFSNANELSKVTIPDGIIEIGDYVFDNCTSLASAILPDSLKKIGSRAFSGCSRLLTIDLPDHLTEIGYGAFASCLRMYHMELPASLEKIGESVFAGCEMLTSAGPAGKDYAIEFGWTKSIPDHAFEYSNKLETVELPSTIETIGNNAFNYCIELESIVLPYELKSIGEYAFSNCTKLQEIEIPSNIRTINGYTFNSCTNLKRIHIPFAVKNVNYSAFNYAGLEDVYYYGTEEEWKQIYIDYENDPLLNANIIFLPGIRVNLDQDEAVIGLGRELQLSAAVTPEEFADVGVIWSSSDPSVAEVSDTGIVSAKALGTATITVMTMEGEAIDTCEVTVVEPVIGISLDQTEVTASVNESFQLNAVIEPDTAYNRNVTWSSEDPSIASVNEEGYVYCSNPGTVVIKAVSEDGGLEATCTVTVIRHVYSIRLNTSWMTLNSGQTANLYVFVEPYDATDKTIRWESSDPSVATVDENGAVTGVSRGTAEIRAISEDGGYTASCNLTVIQPVTGVKIDQNTVTAIIGQGIQLNHIVLPDDANRTEVMWASSDYTVASVDGNGYVTAIGKGTAEVTVTTQDGSYTDTCTVSVIQPVNQISLNALSMIVPVGSDTQLTALIKPATADNQNVIWRSDNPSAASVNTEGIVHAKAAGTAVISAVTEDGGYEASCEITVIAPVQGVTLNKTSANMNVGQSMQLRAAVTPANAANQQLIWDSNDLTVAEVDSDGNVTAIGKGTTVVTVTTADGNYTAECTVNVIQPAEGISLNRLSVVIPTGKQIQLTALVSPATADNRNVIWESSDTSVMTVDANGNVTGKSAGAAFVIVTSSDGNFTAECEVTIVDPVRGVSLNKASASMNVGQTMQLRATVAPATAANQQLIWDSSDLTVAEVDAEGNVTAIGKGTATITVTTDDGGYTADCTVTVQQPVSGVGLSKNTLTMINGETTRLTAVVLPGNADNREVIWTSSNNSVASVDENGYISAINNGTSLITVRTADGSYTAVCELTVKEEDPINIYGSSLALEGKIGINFFLDINEENINDLTIVMKMNGEETRVDAGKGTVRTVSGKDYRMYEYPVAAKEMRDIVTLTVEDKTGNNVKLIKDDIDYTDGYPFSAADYFARAEEAGMEKTKKLTRVLNNYGKYAQIYFGYHVTDEVRDTKDVGSVTLETLEPYQAVMDSTELVGLSYVGGSAMLDDAIGYRLYFNLETGHEIAEYTFTIDGKKVTPVLRSGTQYYIEKANIAAKDLGVMNEIKVTKGTTTKTIRYSALSYAYTALGLTEEKRIPLQNMCRAMYLYNQQSIEYFAN